MAGVPAWRFATHAPWLLLHPLRLLAAALGLQSLGTSLLLAALQAAAMWAICQVSVNPATGCCDFRTQIQQCFDIFAFGGQRCGVAHKASRFCLQLMAVQQRRPACHMPLAASETCDSCANEWLKLYLCS